MGVAGPAPFSRRSTSWTTRRPRPRHRPCRPRRRAADDSLRERVRHSPDAAGEPVRPHGPARRARRRRLPRRAGADGHGGRAAVDPRRSRGLDARSARRRGSSTATCSSTWSRCRWPGRLADLWGTRRLFLVALVAFTLGLVARRPRPDARRADRRAARPGGRRRHPRPGRRRPPRRTCSRAHARPRALGVIGALTFLGMAAGPFVGAAILGAVHPDGPWRAPGSGSGGARRRPRAGLAVGLLPQRADRHHRARARLGRERRLGDAAARGPGRPAGRAAVLDRPGGRARSALTLLGEPDRRSAASTRDRRSLVAGLVAVVVRSRWRSSRGLRAAGPVPRRAAVPVASFISAALVSLLTGYAFATAIVGGAVFVDRVLYGGPDEQRLALGRARRRDGASVRWCRASSSACSSLRLVDARRAWPRRSSALVAMAGWTPATSVAEVALALAVVRARLRADRHAALHGRGRGARPAASGSPRRP